MTGDTPSYYRRAVEMSEQYDVSADAKMLIVMIVTAAIEAHIGGAELRQFMRRLDEKRDDPLGLCRAAGFGPRLSKAKGERMVREIYDCGFLPAQ